MALTKLDAVPPGGSHSGAMRTLGVEPRTSGIHLFPWETQNLEPKWLRHQVKGIICDIQWCARAC
eukprot:8235720-Pyramimonas_sp.AAC.1